MTAMESTTGQTPEQEPTLWDQFDGHGTHVYVGFLALQYRAQQMFEWGVPLEAIQSWITAHGNPAAEFVDSIEISTGLYWKVECNGMVFEPGPCTYDAIEPWLSEIGGID